MNLYWRLLWLMLTRSLRPPCGVLGPCLTPFRVLPTDLDLLRHVNNGVYFSLLDVARIDMMQRSGLAAYVRAQGWYPVVTAETIQFRRSLHLLQRFAIESRVVGWDERAFLIHHRFLRKKSVLAEAAVQARFLRKGGRTVSPHEVIATHGVGVTMPETPEWIARWSRDQEALRRPRLRRCG